MNPCRGKKISNPNGNRPAKKAARYTGGLFRLAKILALTPLVFPCNIVCRLGVAKGAYGCICSYG
jgi:hypothetical protein